MMRDMALLETQWDYLSRSDDCAWLIVWVELSMHTSNSSAVMYAWYSKVSVCTNLSPESLGLHYGNHASKQLHVNTNIHQRHLVKHERWFYTSFNCLQSLWSFRTQCHEIPERHLYGYSYIASRMVKLCYLHSAGQHRHQYPQPTRHVLHPSKWWERHTGDTGQNECHKYTKRGYPVNFLISFLAFHMPTVLT